MTEVDKSAKSAKSSSSLGPSELAIYQDYLMMPSTDNTASLAKRHELKSGQVSHLIKSNGWDIEKQKLEQQVIHAINHEYRKFSAEKRIEIAQRHVKLAELVEAQLLRKLTKKDGTPRDRLCLEDLKEIAQTMRHATQVDARAVGLHDRGTSLVGDREKTPVLVVGVEPKRAQVIEVEAV